MEFLKELFTEALSFEQFTKAVSEKGIKLADLSKGEYVAKAKLNAEIEKTKAVTTQLNEINTELAQLKESNASAEDYKTKFEELNNQNIEREKQAKAQQDEQILVEAITKSFGESQFVNDYVKNGIINDMKSEISKAENKGKGYSEIFGELTKDKEGIFASKHPGTNVGGNQGSGGVDFDKTKATYDELVKYLESNPNENL